MSVKHYFLIFVADKHITMKKILIISPHADDEILGCGGYILSELAKGSKIRIVIGAVGGTINQARNMRCAELDAVKSALDGVEYYVMRYDLDARLDTIPAFDITSIIDKHIAEFKPDEFFVNYPSHHQDHVKVYDCAMAALRLKDTYMPPLVALYEYPYILNHCEIINGGRWYHDISKHLDRKCELFEMYKSQVKPAPSPLNRAGIETLARTRGFECGLQYAEMFYIQKLMR